MVKAFKILISTLMTIALFTSNMHFYAYANTCSTSNKFEISLDKHECSADCCGESCMISFPDMKKNCCSDTPIYSLDEQPSNNKCCNTETISFYNPIDLQMVFNTLNKLEVSISYLDRELQLIHSLIKKHDVLLKDSSIDIPPPISTHIAVLHTKFNISDEDDDYYYYC